MKVKFCGITRPEDAEAAISAGAWAIGLNHFAASPRYVEPDTRTQIAALARRRTLVAGVFVNAGLGEIRRAVEDEALDMVQLHGDEGPAFCREIARRTGATVIKAFRVASSAEVQAAEAYRTDLHLFDAHHPGARGGTGESFDWELLAARTSSVPMVLAGGLDPENVGAAIAAVRPHAVDVASGVESEPGRKSAAKMLDFAEAARAAAAAAAA